MAVYDSQIYVIFMQLHIFICAVEKLKLRTKRGRSYDSSNRFVSPVVRGKNMRVCQGKEFQGKNKNKNGLSAQVNSQVH